MTKHAIALIYERAAVRSDKVEDANVTAYIYTFKDFAIGTEKVEFDNEYVDLFSRLGILIDLKIIIETVIKVFHKENIYEVKSDQVLNDEEDAKIAEQEIIRIAHLPD